MQKYVGMLVIHRVSEDYQFIFTNFYLQSDNILVRIDIKIKLIIFYKK